MRRQVVGGAGGLLLLPLVVSSVMAAAAQDVAISTLTGKDKLFYINQTVAITGSVTGMEAKSDPLGKHTFFLTDEFERNVIAVETHVLPELYQKLRVVGIVRPKELREGSAPFQEFRGPDQPGAGIVLAEVERFAVGGEIAPVTGAMPEWMRILIVAAVVVAVLALIVAGATMIFASRRGPRMRPAMTMPPVQPHPMQQPQEQIPTVMHQAPETATPDYRGWLEVIDGDPHDRGKRFDLVFNGGHEQQGRITIGRSAERDIVLEAEPIGRKQATILDLAGSLVLINEGTVNPTKLNDKKIGPGEQAVLHDGDHLTMGSDELVVKLAS